MIKHYFKLAFRNLWKNKMHNVISIVGLSVGLLCFCVCMYCSRFVKEINRCFEHHARIVELAFYNEKNNIYFSGTQVALSEELRTWAMGEVEAISCMAYPRKRSYMVEISEDKSLPYDLETVEVDTVYDRVFTPRIVAGNWNTAKHTPNSVVLSRLAAMKMFGGPASAIGKHLTLMRRLYTSPSSTPKTGGIVYTVQAVMEDIPLNNSINFMTPMDALALNDSEGLFQSPKREDMTGALTFALLAPHADMAALERQFSKRNYKYTLYNEQYTVVSRAIDDKKQNQGAFIGAWITGIVGTLILLVGLINFFHFLIGSFLNRTKEYSIMKVVGCSWQQLFWLLFVQSSIVIGLSSLLVLCGIEWMDGKMDFSLPRFTMVFSSSLLLKHALQYTLFLLLLCALICLAVSVRIRKITIQIGIRGNNRQHSKQRGRNLMQGIQFFICWIFVSFTVALFLQSEKTTGTLFHTLSRDEKESILSIPLDYPFLNNKEKLSMVERFGQYAGVKDILLSDISYTQGVSGNALMTEKGNENSWIEINIMAVPENFFAFMNIPIEEGKGIQTQQDIVVDKVWQEQQKKNVIGMNFYNPNKDFTVCGICASFQTDVYHTMSGYAFMLYDPSIYVGHCYVKCYPEQRKETVKWIEKIQREMLPENISSQVCTFQDDLYERQVVECSLKDIILFFAVVSILITLLGVYSSITLDTERRQKEVAVRKINGAGGHHIIWLFARLYATLLVSTAALSFPLIYVTLQWWRRMYTVFFDCGYRFWIGIFAFVVLITVGTVWFRIRKIVRSNPVEFIKNE